MYSKIKDGCKYLTSLYGYASIMVNIHTGQLLVNPDGLEFIRRLPTTFVPREAFEEDDNKKELHYMKQPLFILIFIHIRILHTLEQSRSFLRGNYSDADWRFQ